MNTQKKWTIITGVIIVIVSVVVAWGYTTINKRVRRKTTT